MGTGSVFYVDVILNGEAEKDPVQKPLQSPWPLILTSPCHPGFNLSPRPQCRGQLTRFLLQIALQYITLCLRPLFKSIVGEVVLGFLHQVQVEVQIVNARECVAE